MKGATTTISSLLLLAAIQAVTCNVSMDPRTFFPSIQGNLTKIVWAHAVNSQEKLSEALKNGDIMMLEADVVLGRLNSSNENETKIPIMAHPPATESDLSLEDFLKNVMSNRTKGIKLDFKSIEAFDASKLKLENVRSDINLPVLLNADILSGPVNSTDTPVDAASFLSAAKAYPNYTLSIGWTTKYGVKPNVTEGSYTKEQVQAMIDTVKGQNITQPITYPVRAGLAANDIEVMKSLIQKSSQKDVSLTIWSSEGDKVDAQKLSTLIKEIGVEKVYVDVPADLMKQLHLSGASSLSATTMMLVPSLLISMFLSTFSRRV